MVAHIRSHVLQYQCKFCEKRFNHLEMIKVHHDIMHQSKDETYRNIDVSENLSKFAAMKIIYPNGFVLTKAEAKHTSYGVMDDIVAIVNEMNENDLDAVRQRQNEKAAKDGSHTQETKGAKSFALTKKNVKRSRICDSDSDERNPPTTSTTNKQTVRKRRKTMIEPTGSRSRDVESPATSEENLPLKTLATRFNSPSRKSPRKSNPVSKPLASDPIKTSSSAGITSGVNEPPHSLIPVSHYGKRPKAVDLSKIFIEMPFGAGGSVSVSCDRFALLFNINPKLRLKRCDHLLK